MPSETESVDVVRNIILTAVAGSLGTTTYGGKPFVTLVTVAALGPRKIVMLLSGLAKHTKNLLTNPECSLLLVASGGESGDPLAGARVTLTGTVTRLEREGDADARAAFLRHQPSAEMYAEFGDFSFFVVHIHEAHLVAGFGRIETITADDL